MLGSLLVSNMRLGISATERQEVDFCVSAARPGRELQASDVDLAAVENRPRCLLCQSRAAGEQPSQVTVAATGIFIEGPCHWEPG